MIFVDPTSELSTFPVPVVLSRGHLIETGRLQICLDPFGSFLQFFLADIVVIGIFILESWGIQSPDFTVPKLVRYSKFTKRMETRLWTFFPVC